MIVLLRQIKLFFVVFFLTFQVFAGSDDFRMVRFYVKTGDYSALKQAINDGLDIDSVDGYNRTSLCYSVYEKDYASFEVLSLQGANRKHTCMKEMLPSVRSNFYNNMPKTMAYRLGLNVLKIGNASKSYSMMTTSLFLAGGAGIGVAIAAGGGGGGGGGSSGSGGTGGGKTPNLCSGIVCASNAHCNQGTCVCNTNYEGDPITAGCTAKTCGVNEHLEGSDCVCDTGTTKVNGSCQLSLTNPYRNSPSQFETEEYLQSTLAGTAPGENSSFLSPIKASSAYARYFTLNADGTFNMNNIDTVRVAVWDNGVADISQLNLSKNSDGTIYRLGGGPYTLTSGSNAHGTNVASLIGAKRDGLGMHGVAPNAEIISVNAWDPSDTSYFSGYFTQLSSYGTRVVNMSWGLDSATLTADEIATKYTQYVKPYFESVFKTVASSNMAFVISAGNDRVEYPTDAKNPQLIAGVPLLDTFSSGTYSLKNLMVVSVALNSDTDGIASNDTIANFSNYCGVAQEYCVGAPGVRVAVTNPDGTVSRASGTSFSAPITSGSIALLMGLYPHMTTQEVVQLLLFSADYIPLTPDQVGDGQTEKELTITVGGVDVSKYVNTVTGHGEINLESATSAFGGQTLALGTSDINNQVSLSSNTRLTVPKIFSSSLNKVIPKKIMFLDGYRRAFYIDSSNFFKETHRGNQQIEKKFHAFMNTQKMQKVDLGSRSSFSFTTMQHSQKLGNYAFAQLNYGLTDKSTVQFNYFADTQLKSGNYFEKVLSNPFVNMTNAYGMGTNYQVNSKLNMAFNVLTGKNGFFDGDEDLDYYHDDAMGSFSTDLTYKPHSLLSLTAHSGMVKEQGSLFGLNGQGAFETQSTNTYFMGATVALHKKDEFKLSASYYYGMTPKVGKINPFLSLDSITSENFAFDAKRFLGNEENFIGVQLASPLRIKSGQGTFDFATSRDTTGNTVYREKFTTSLTPDAREYDLTAYYQKDFLGAKFNYSLGTRFNPDHIKGASPDFWSMMRVIFNF